MEHSGAKIKMEPLQVIVRKKKFFLKCLTNTLGLVGELQKENSDIGWADLFVVPDRMKYIDYTDPYDIEPASFMLSK